MNQQWGRMAAALALTASGTLALAACSNDPSPTTKGSGSGSLPQGAEKVDLKSADFSTTIDNPYFPLKPGTRMTYTEIDTEGASAKVVVTVTSGTKVLANGVTARVVRDTASEDGVIVEDTFDWYAQDRQGNVWYLGEDTAEFENGAVKSRAGSFETGVDGAQAGIAMPAHPAVGTSYRQEYLKGEAEDQGEILSLAEKVGVPFGAFDKALLTRDSTPLEPDQVEYKLYAPGIGQVLAVDISGGSAREELISVKQVADGAGLSQLGQPDA
ncbi:MAG: hypothetical protein ABIN55_11155 [Aeromicrobium sp.]